MSSQLLRRSKAERTLPARTEGVLERALGERDLRAARRRSVKELTLDQRLEAFWSGELSLRQCLEWSSFAPHEVPLAADGEFLYIACRTPEWLGE